MPSRTLVAAILTLSLSASHAVLIPPISDLLTDPSPPSSPYDSKSTFHQAGAAAEQVVLCGDRAGEEIKLVPVQLAVMAKCPDAQLCESVFDKVLSQVGDKVDLSLVYIGITDSSATYGVDCKHGDEECKGNIQQLCYRQTFPQWQKWWSFIQCQNYSDISNIGKDWLARTCARVGGEDWTDVESCVNKEGARLLQRSVRQAEHMGATKSCSIFINNQLVCIHDGTWKNCDTGHDVRDFVSEINAAYRKLNG